MKRQIKIPRQESLLMPDVQNPFTHTLDLKTSDYVKIALMSVTIAPVRLLLIGFLLLLAWPMAAIAIAFRSKEEKQLPLSGWRKSFQGPLKFLGSCCIFMAGFHRIKMKGQRAPACDAPVLCIAPHSSFFDSFILFCCEGLPSFVTRTESLSVPVCGTLIEFTQPVYVTREDPNSRVNTIKEIQRRAHSGGQWPQVIIFPEGTCTNRSCLITFKPGAFYAGVPVQPVCIKYPNRLDTITWTWEGPGAFACLWLTLCQLHNYMEIEFLPVYVPSEEEDNDAKLYANNVRAKMANCLDVPITDHTYDDCRLMMRAAKLNMPMTAGIVEVHKLHRKLGLNFDAMQELLVKFCEIAQEKEHITLKEFASYLHIPVSPALEEVFNMYDRSGSGTIDFREYIIGLSLVASPVNTEETIQLAFQVFDSGNKGYITQKELEGILHSAFNMEDIDVAELFDEVDSDQDGKITFDEFRVYGEQKPEYARLFQTYQELQTLHQNGEADKEWSDAEGDDENSSPKSKAE